MTTNWVPAPEPWTNQSLPDTAIHNNLMAMFWKDIQIVYTPPSTNTGIILATAGP